jgi:hypothetical protein
MDGSIFDEVVEQLCGMPQSLQKQVLEFAKNLTDQLFKEFPVLNCCVLQA